MHLHSLNPHRNLSWVLSFPFSSDEETATQRGEGMCAGGTSGRWLAAGTRTLALNQHARYLGYSHLVAYQLLRGLGSQVVPGQKS